MAARYGENVCGQRWESQRYSARIKMSSGEVQSDQDVS